MGTSLGEPGGGVAVQPGRAAHGRQHRLGRRRTEKGERKERVERERDLPDSKFEFFSKLSVEIWKTLNIKVVENLKAYNFYFRKKFIRAMV